MSGQELERITSLLVAEAGRVGANRGLFGAEIGIFLRRVMPDFRPQDFGADALRGFIEKCVPQLKIIGRNGSDLIYGLKEWPELGPQGTKAIPEEAEEDQFWRIWVSPGSQHSIAIAKDGTRVRAVLRGKATPDEIELLPANVEIHRAIAREYLAERAGALGELAPILANILDQEPDSWWMEWSKTFRGTSRDLGREWMQFRQESLEKALRKRLVELQVGKDAVGKVLEVTESARKLWKQRKTLAVAQSSPMQRGTPTFPVHTNAAAIVRNLAASLTAPQVQSLAILLGIVVDALIEKPRRY